ncbi:MMPL family transporter [Sanguibacter sp. 25GB23B1]|uniref:MMPL family transporter n=1 Tax=unclassified Sanguibacter TaxID=2645534 RepID=UPI0032AF5502
MNGKVPLAVRHPVRAVLGWLLVLAASLPLAGTLGDHLATATIEASGSESALARQAIADTFAGAHRYDVVVTADGAGTGQCADLGDALGDRYDATVVGVEQPRPGDCFVRLGVDEDPNGLVEALRADRAELELAAGHDVLVGGAPGISADIGHVSEENVASVEKLALPIVFLLLLLVFRSPLAAIIPLLTGGAAIVVSSGVLALVAQVVDLSPLTRNVVTMLGLGVSIDYALFVTRRFRQERAAGADVVGALTRTQSTTGRSVVWAGITVAVSLGALLVPGSLVTTSVAVGGSVVVAVSVLMSWTLLPAILRLVGHRFRVRPVPDAQQTQVPATSGRRSARYARLVTERPWLALALGTGVLLALAVPAADLDMHLPAAAYGDLPDGTESRAATELLVDALGEGAVFPIVLHVVADEAITDASTTTDLAAAVTRIETVDGVRAVVAPALLETGAPDGVVSDDGTSTVVRVVLDSPAGSEAARDVVTTLRAETFSGLDVRVTGETATGMDVDGQIGDSLPVTLALLALITIVLLLAALRSLAIAVKAVVLNALVTLATVGLLVGVFQHEWFSLVDPAPVNVNTPIVMFALLFGLSVDYEVIIVGRMRESWQAGLPMKAAVREGLASTAGMVNGAASIMIVVFAAFTLSDFRIVQELGFGLAVAVLLDVLVVRSVLVPSAMVLIGEKAFWPGRRHDASRGAPTATGGAPSAADGSGAQGASVPVPVGPGVEQVAPTGPRRA